MNFPLAAIDIFGQKAEPHDLIIVGLLVVLEGVLSIDNALVLGLLAKRVPKRLQARALTYGLVGALIFRMAAIGAATWLLQWTWAKLLGGAYLIFLGIKMLLDRRRQLSLPSNFRRRTTIAAFRQGVFTNVLNPKVALFFLAFLPQFIDPASNMKVFAFLMLGLTFVTTGTIWCLILAWFASAFSERLRTNETIGQWLNRAAGALFVFLGLRLATAK